MSRFALCALLLAAAPTRGATLSAEPLPDKPAVVRLDSAVDDAHLANPPGYHPAEPPADRVVTRIVIENVGLAALCNPDVRVNGAPLLPVADPVAALGLDASTDFFAIFSAWRDRRIHGTIGLRLNRDPREVLRAFGATFCGDDSNALAAIAASREADVRFVWVNGHSVAEFRFPGRDWQLFDGDQNVFYPRWDNQTPAAGADILDDPLLALRVKAFGRNARWDAPTAWQNTARFEFIDRTRPQKIYRPKPPPPARDWELRPGERIEIRLDETPAVAVAANEDLRRDPRLLAALCRVEFFPAAAGERRALPFPLAGESPGDPRYEGDAAIPMIGQAARAQFPSLRAGENRIEVDAAGLRVTFETRVVPFALPPAPAVRVAPGGAPAFALAVERADRVWWQIATDATFRVIAPNLDCVAAFAPVVGPDSPLDATFLSPGHEYAFRAKVRRDGAWSDWSAPVLFSVQKPPRPRIEHAQPLSTKTARIRWEPSDAGEMLVFGSNRLDFLPEIFAATEPVRMESGAILESRPASNLLATVAADQREAIVPARAAYRLIARDGKTLSVPSALVRMKGAPLAKVLQDREEKAEGALTGRDVAREMDAP